MKKLFTIFAIISSFLAILLAVLPVSNLAIFPSIAALVFGTGAFYLSKRTGQVKKIIQFTFLLTILALTIAIYKAIFTEIKIGNTEGLEAKETKLEETIKELDDIQLDKIEINKSGLEDILAE
ncbi:FUSC family protein [Flavisericum labens]|uniref:FUSC family protein n=1 Tax=Flavisericum labens TaxID=3377112 RepID=UPI00387B4727